MSLMESNACSHFMKSRSSVEIRRCRPLLGTFVEIAARGKNIRTLELGIDAAFAAVTEVHRLMSFHDPARDVSRMNRDAFPKGVAVHPWTWRVLQSAQQFTRESDGVFDIAIASLLTKWNYLPRCGYRFDIAATSRDIFLKKNHRVFFHRRVMVDLGGIAKGFAVDRAVDALRRNGVSSGIVNAGGDLRVFGDRPRQIHVRHPLNVETAAGAVILRNRALATSANYFSQQRCGETLLTPLTNGRTREACVEDVSVTVAANDCLAADALTKIVVCLRDKAQPILARYRADAVLLERDLAPHSFFTSHASRFHQA
jgi:thiamine biosynthesis lipoprotein